MFDRVVAGSGRSWRRRGLAVGSVAVHAAAILGLLAWSLLSVEEIAPPAIMVTFVRAAAPPPPPPPPPPAGPSATPRPAKAVEKPVRPLVQPTETTEPVQKTPDPEPVEEPDPTPAPVAEAAGEAGGQAGGVAGGTAGGTVGGTVGGQKGGVLGGTAGGTGSKLVAEARLLAEQLRHPNPRLPQWFVSSHPRQTVKGSYKVCIGTGGAVADVTPMTSIPGADEAIIEHIRREWLYKPQPVPVCTLSLLVFKIN